MIRRPDAIRLWQHVLEPLSAYLRLAKPLWQYGALDGAYNFGPQTQEVATVGSVVEQARAVYGGGEIITQNDHLGPNEAGCLMPEITEARTLLGIKPQWTLSETINKTLGWDRDLSGGRRADELCASEINTFETSGAPPCMP